MVGLITSRYSGNEPVVLLLFSQGGPQTVPDQQRSASLHQQFSRSARLSPLLSVMYAAKWLRISSTHQCRQLSRIIRETPDFGPYLPVSRLESNISRIIVKIAISCTLDFLTIKFQILCVV